MKLRSTIAAVALCVAAASSAAAQSDASSRFCAELDPATTAEIAAAECAAFVRDSTFAIEIAASANETHEAALTAPWYVTDIERDRVSGEPVAIAALEAELGSSKFGRPISLVIRCSNGETNLFVGWNDYIGPRSEVEVSLRIDDGDIDRQRWYTSTDDDTTFYSLDAVSFIESLFDGRHLAVQTTFDEGPVTALFDITEIETAVGGVRVACGW